jgi:beta-glucosidase
VVVLIHGGPLAIPEIAKSARAILDGFYLGEETGNALAAVLFGDVSPAGRLPISVPRGVGTVPAFYNAKPSAGRLYLFEEAGPLWPFGFGLSYTTFEYGNPSVTPARIPPDGRAHVTLRVTNTGVRASDEVVQAYVRDRVSSVTRPLRELKWFRRVHIEAGAAQDLGFDLGASELSFFDAKMDRVVEPGVFEVTVGGSSVEGKTARFEVVRP